MAEFPHHLEDPRLAGLREQLLAAVRSAHRPAVHDPQTLVHATLSGLLGRELPEDRDALLATACAALVEELRRARSASEDCPSPDALVETARYRPARARHHCAGCAREHEVIVAAFHGPPPPEAEIIPLFPNGPPREASASTPERAVRVAKVQPAPREAPPGSALARAARLVLGGLALLGVLVTLAVLPTYLDPPAASLGSTVQLASEAPEQIPAGEPVVLAWSGAPPGSVYSVVVRGAALKPLAEVADLTEPTWTLPGELTRDLSPPARLIWQIEGRTPEGDAFRSPRWVLRVTSPR